jgi:hypothetical protein
MSTQQYLDIAEVCRRYGRNGRPLNPSTVWRWMMSGVGPEKARLWHMRIGGRHVTTEAALDAFLSLLNPSPEPAPTVRSPAARERAANRAKKQLEKMGV